MGIIAPLFLQYRLWHLILSSSDVTIKENQISNYRFHAVYSAESADLPEEIVAAADTPVIALTHVPKYGEVFLESAPKKAEIVMEEQYGTTNRSGIYM